MSVIQRIQQRQKWVFGAIALALILFIVQDKFMGKGSSSGPGSTIAKINGEALDNADFKSQQELIKQTSQQEIDQDQLSTYVWQNMENNTVLNQEYKKLGLTYTSREFQDDIASNDPPQWFAQQFMDQKTGVYNAAGAVNYMNQAAAQIRKSPGTQQAVLFQKAVIDQSHDAGLLKKYQALVTGAVYVPKWVAAKTTADNNSIANISYVNVPYSSVNDSTVKVSDDEVNAYVKKHAKEFDQKEETRQIAYISFDAYPSSLDTAAVVGDLIALKGEFKAATDLKSFLEEKGSPLRFYDSYIAKSQIQQPNKDTLFKMQPGEVFGPYKDAGNFVLAKLVDVKQLPDSATVRHILVATHTQDQSGQLQRIREDSVASKRLDSAIAEINSGKNFDSVCLKYSDDEPTKATGGVYKFFPTGQMMESFNDFSFEGKTGDKKVVHTPYGFHYVQILGQKGSEPAYKFAYLGKAVTVSQVTDDSAKNSASQFAGTTHDLKEFYANAAKIGKVPFSIPGIKENDFTLSSPNQRGQGGLGKNRPFVRWVYDNDLGAISDAEHFDQKYVVAIITGINKPGLPGAETTRPMVEPRVKNEKKAKIIVDTKIKGSTLEAIAQSSGGAVQQADSISFQSPIIKNLGLEPKVTGAAFNKSIQGKVSDPIAGETAVYVIKGNGIAGVVSTQQGTSPEAQRTAAELNLKRQQAQPGQVLLKAADIKDYRSKFY